MVLENDVLATIYAQGTAIALILGLMFISVHLKKRKRTRDKMFYSMCINVLIMSVFLAINVLLRYRTFTGARELILITTTVSELSLIMMLFQWLVFVDYLIYESWDHVMRHFKTMFVPVMCEGVIYFVNLITTLFFKTGIIFNVDNNLIYTRCPLFWSAKIVETAYFVVTIVMIVKYRKSSKTPVFIKLSPMIVPFALGSLVSVFTDYSAHSLGLAVGLVLLHFSFMSGYCYVDERLGCYNKAYLEFINRYTKEKSLSGGTGIVFSSVDKEKEFADILLDDKPKNSDVIYVGKGKFLMISETQRKSSIHMLLDLIEEAAEEKGVKYSADFAVRKLDESPDEFVGRLLAE